MQKGDKVGIVCCSNGQSQGWTVKMKLLTETLSEIGLEPILSPFIYEKEGGAAGTAKERAEALMNFYNASSVKAIFDISGGDLANEILPYLDYEVIRQSGKQFWGYSDLTTVINAIYAKTGKDSVLYQVRNLIYDFGEKQRADFSHTLLGQTSELYDFPYRFCQGDHLQGVVVGGNIRCLLKLAGTEYFPDMEGKILLLEALHGTAPQIVTYFSQLKQMGIFDKVAGILLGTFSQMEQENCRPDVVTLLKRFVAPDFPIVQTAKIGHGTDSKGIVIGRQLVCCTDHFQQFGEI